MLYLGVSLGNVLPNEKIRYGIKNYLFEAYTRISSDNIPVQEVLRVQGSVEERLMLKRRLILGRNIYKLKINPSSLLWVVRHFIGHFPTPLFPEKDNQYDYLWTEITKFCKTSVASYVTRGRYNTELVKLIANKLSKLPEESFTLIVSVFDSMRLLAVLPNGEPRINKASAFALVEYFSASLFLRPFHSESTKQIAQQYYPLNLFLILKWAEIKNFCIQFRQINCHVSTNRLIGHKLRAKRQFIRRSNDVSNADPNSSDVEMRFDSPFHTASDHLQDVACQTDDVLSNLQRSCLKNCCCGMLREEKQNSATKVIYIKQKKCCCTYGTNHESVLPTDNFFDLEEEQISSDLPTSLLECQQKSSTALFTDSKILYDKIQHFDPIEKEVGSNAIKNKIAKVGWTYIPNSPIDKLDEYDLEHDSVESTFSIGWNVKNETGNSFENIRKSLNAELKEKFTQKEEENERKSVELNDQTSSSKLSLPKMWNSISKESRNSVNKIKQRLSIMKLLPDKNNKSVIYCNHKESKVKYKRVESENSIDKC